MVLAFFFSTLILVSAPFTHRLHCQDPWFHFLKKKEKTIEGRLAKDGSSLIQVGDQIEFYNQDQTFLLSVTKVQHFATLFDYLETVGLKNALPGVETIEEGCKVYLQFYSEEDLHKFGILAFSVE